MTEWMEWSIESMHDWMDACFNVKIIDIITHLMEDGTSWEVQECMSAWRNQ